MQYNPTESGHTNFVLNLLIYIKYVLQKHMVAGSITNAHN